MNDQLAFKLFRAKEIIQIALHASMATVNEDALKVSYYQNDSPQRLYGAEITNFWIPLSDRDENGNVLRDYRHEITREELLQ